MLGRGEYFEEFWAFGRFEAFSVLVHFEGFLAPEHLIRS
jgi:hypothetical protein